jgi:hypothetical protein
MPQQTAIHLATVAGNAGAPEPRRLPCTDGGTKFTAAAAGWLSRMEVCR